MISVQQALNLVGDHSLSLSSEKINLSEALNRVLAQPVLADRDAPPFNRITMDGIAINSEGLKVSSTFSVEGIQAAGQPQGRLERIHNCMEVMTGAVLPENTDCVVPYEQIDMERDIARLKSTNPIPFQYVHKQGTDAKKGDILLQPNQVVTPAVIGVLAAVGISQVMVKAFPKIAICSTGDELVDIDQQPEPHQIRKSNAFMLQGAVLELGIKPDIFHLKDEKKEMFDTLKLLLDKYQVLMFSGAVSKGKYDFLPKVLEELGMKKIIHGVVQRPGKPFLFGTFPNTTVFGFPGNPTSTLVCFTVYFRTWLRCQLGLPVSKYSARLTEDLNFAPPLTYHALVKLAIREGALWATPISNSGSGDLVHLTQADGVLSLPPENQTFQKGGSYPLSLFGKASFID